MSKIAEHRESRCRAFSVLELLVTLIVVGLMAVSVTLVLYHVNKQSSQMSYELERVASLENCLDWLIDDVVNAAQIGAKMDISNASYSQLDTSHLIIKPVKQMRTSSSRIEWIAAPRSEQEDLVLFRCKRETGVVATKYYVPMCDSLQSFRVKLHKPKQERKDNREETREEDREETREEDREESRQEDREEAREEPPYLEVSASLYRDEDRDSDRILTVRRSCCLQRFPK